MCPQTNTESTNTSLLALFPAASDGQAAFYQRDPDGTEVLAIGIDLDKRYHPEMPQVHWCAFDKNYVSTITSPWTDFSRHTSYTPRVVIFHNPTRTDPILILSRSEERRTHWNNLLENPPHSSTETPHHLETTFLDESPFRDGIRHVIEDQPVSKVVLARRARISTDAPIPPAEVLRNLSSDYPNCTLFAIAPTTSSHQVFIGATPESLVHLRRQKLSTMALAGTTRQAKKQTRDDAEKELLNSAKDLEEHRFVRDMIADALNPICDDLHIPHNPSILRLANISHLHTPIFGRLKQGRTLSDAADALHPTPAVCGTPRDDAMRLITELEQFDRGLYAGFFGWSHGDQGTLDVALRSALLDKDGATLYAGAGITKDSDADIEWAETSQKFVPLLDAIREVCQ